MFEGDRELTWLLSPSFSIYPDATSRFLAFLRIARLSQDFCGGCKSAVCSPTTSVGDSSYGTSLIVIYNPAVSITFSALGESAVNTPSFVTGDSVFGTTSESPTAMEVVPNTESFPNLMEDLLSKSEQESGLKFDIQRDATNKLFQQPKYDALTNCDTEHVTDNLFSTVSQKSKLYLEAAKINLADNNNNQTFPIMPTLEQGVAVS